MAASEAASKDSNNAGVQMSNELFERFVKALEQLASERTGETVEPNAATARWQTQALLALADGFNNRSADTGGELTLAQRELALSYDAFKTALGRTGVASIVVGVRSKDTIEISQTSLPSGNLTVQAYSSGKDIGSGPLSGADDKGVRRATIPNLLHYQAVERFSILDQSGTPILFGLLKS